MYEWGDYRIGFNNITEFNISKAETRWTEQISTSFGINLFTINFPWHDSLRQIYYTKHSILLHTIDKSILLSILH